MEAFQSAPFHVAPERADELIALRDKYDIGIYLKGNAEDWLFHEFRLGKRILVGLRTLERLWAYCYGYNTIVTELQEAGLGGFEKVRNREEYWLAFTCWIGLAKRTLTISKAVGRTLCPTLHLWMS